MRLKSSASTIFGAWLLASGQLVLANPAPGLNLKDVCSPGDSSIQIKSLNETMSNLRQLSADSSILMAAGIDDSTEALGLFDSAQWKSSAEKDPNLLANFDRFKGFWRFLSHNDAIGMKLEQLTDLLGKGQKLKDSKDDANGSLSYLVAIKIKGLNEISTFVEFDLKDGAVTRWRLARANNKYPLKETSDAFRADAFSPWVSKNMIESNICDAGLKIKRSLGFSDPVNAESFEQARPTFELVQQKAITVTEEPLPLIVLPPQPTSAELLDAAVSCQQVLLVKVSRDYAEKAIKAAKTEAERKQAKDFIVSRLPLKTPSWTAEYRHLEAYSASARIDPDAAINAYEKNIVDEPAFEYSYYMLGMIKRENGNYAGAQALFEKVLKINPKYQKAIYGLASVFDHAGDAQTARKLALQAYSLYPYDKSSQAIFTSVTHEMPPSVVKATSPKN